ncbi:MAG TPA: hypothetical protein VFU21_26940 [Kofleriaceae bacterium]|nr:hypothetical protein [Kofleriaceae bacterium]
MLRLFIGLVKGAVVGGAVGYGAYYLGLGGAFHWITYGVIGALVGLLCGRPIWSHLLDKSSTTWTAILKGIFGFGIGVGLYALVAKVWGGFELSMLDETRLVQDWPFALGGAIGALYGAFVEVDDKPPPSADKKAAEKKNKA